MEHELFAREGLSVGGSGERPPFYKAVGIGLAIGSGLFIGVSFVMKKVGLLKANEKYNEVAGEGYGYLRNAWWWGGMTLMIIGEICNFVAYAFTDAILVTPLGALSVVITTVLSAIFLKERLSMVGKVACFLCIVGSVVIVMNAPHTSSVSNISEMKDFFITPGFLSYAGVIIVGSAITAFYAGPRWGNKNMLVYISICSWIGGLSVVATQGLGAGIIAWIGGRPEYKEWFLWVLFVFVIGTLLTEIIFLNKALNLFNAALVTPTYYVYFTSTTIITSAILFQGFKGSAQSIVTVVLGFLTICSGVVLLQLSKSAKDVPDTAIFTGDLDQIQTIAEQEQPETEPKADAIRGAAAIVRRISHARMRMEAEELRRLHEEKRAEAMEPITEDGQPQYEWDGIRRRRTFTTSTRSRARSATSPPPTAVSQAPTTHAHPPLGMSRFPDHYDEDDDHDRSTIFSSIAGTLRGRARTNATMPIYEEEYPVDTKYHGPGQPLPLTQIPRARQGSDVESGSYRSRTASSAHGPPPVPPIHVQFPVYDDKEAQYPLSPDSPEDKPPVPPPHSAKRQFSFQRVFRREPGASEEERAGLVGQDSDSGGESAVGGGKSSQRPGTGGAAGGAAGGASGGASSSGAGAGAYV